MRVKTSVTLPRELLLRVDSLAGKKMRRSAIVELALRSYLAREERPAANPRDLEILNRYADELNAEAMDTLEYQVEW